MSWTFLRSSSSRAIEAGLDRLAEADVVGDEQIHPGQAQGLSERLELVGVDANAGPERRLEQVRIGRGDAVPLERVQVGREELRRIEPAARDRLPGLALDDLIEIDFLLPEHLERLPLGVVVQARQPHQRRVVAGALGDDFLDEVLTLANTDKLTGHRRLDHAFTSQSIRAGSQISAAIQESDDSKNDPLMHRPPLLVMNDLGEDKSWIRLRLSA